MRSLRTIAVLLCLALASTLVSSLPAHAATNQKGTYTPVSVKRLLDTRTPKPVPLGPKKTLDLQVTGGTSGIPASGVAAVVINLTVTRASLGGYLVAYPKTATLPRASSINFTKDVTLANIATVKVGTGGKVSIYNSTGTVHVVVDVMGFYAADNAPSATAGPGNEFQTATPERLVNTRTDPDGPLAAKDVLTTYVDFTDSNGNHNDEVRALALNITALGDQGSGYLTTWNGIGNPPTTSTLNYRPATNIANMAIVQTALCSGCTTTEPVQFGVYNGASNAVGVLIDLVGIYTNDSDDSTVGLRFTPITPTRISDSRTPLNGKPLKAVQTQTLKAPSSVAGTDTVALVANAAVVTPSTTTYLTLWESGAAKPAASNLNATKGITAANGVIAELSAANQFNLYNNAGTGNFLIDVTGRFDPGTGVANLRQLADRQDPAPSRVTTERTRAAER